MIARASSEPRPAKLHIGAGASRWLDWWRLVLTHGLERASHAVRTARRATRSTATRGRELVGSGALADLRHPAIAWLGGAALLTGVIVGVAIASPGVERRSAALAGAASFMWMAIRWFAMRMSAPGLATEDPAALRGSLSLGLLAYAIAVTPELRLAAWLVAGAVTAAALVRLGRARQEVVRAVGLAWGVQAVVVAGGWLLRSAAVVALTARG